MLASFVIGFHTRRLDNLLQTLRFLEAWHPEVVEKSELILVCQDRCGKPDTKFAKVQYFNLQVANMQLPTLTNFGVDKATSENIVVLESDRILPKGYFLDAITKLERGFQVTTEKMLRVTKMASDDDIMSGNFPFRHENRSVTNQLLMRNMWSGNTLFKKADFVEAGCMDEEYVGYGWADHDMTLAMEKVGVKCLFRPETELHLYHEPMTYGSGDQKWMFIQNGLRLCRKWNIPQPDALREEISKFSKVIL